ncbi:helix-turn-helix domain-containing protein [Candidatus Bipolaricaulota bacterium]
MKRIGEFLRGLRLEKGLSLKVLGDACDVSSSFLSQAERGLCSISIPTLERVCEALGVTLAEFFCLLEPSTGLSSTTAAVLRAEDQSAIQPSDASIRYRFLSRDFPGRLFEVVIGEIPTGYTYPLASHEGEEFGYLLEGELRLLLGEDEHLLRPGDSYHFGPFAEHGYEALGDKDVRIMWVQTLKDLKIRSGQPKGSSS